MSKRVRKNCCFHEIRGDVLLQAGGRAGRVRGACMKAGRGEGRRACNTGVVGDRGTQAGRLGKRGVNRCPRGWGAWVPARVKGKCGSMHGMHMNGSNAPPPPGRL